MRESLNAVISAVCSCSADKRDALASVDDGGRSSMSRRKSVLSPTAASPQQLYTGANSRTLSISLSAAVRTGDGDRASAFCLTGDPIYAREVGCSGPRTNCAVSGLSTPWVAVIAPSSIFVSGGLNNSFAGDFLSASNMISNWRKVWQSAAFDQ